MILTPAAYPTAPSAGNGWAGGDLLGVGSGAPPPIPMEGGAKKKKKTAAKKPKTAARKSKTAAPKKKKAAPKKKTGAAKKKKTGKKSC